VTESAAAPEPDVRPGALEALTALFALGREVTSVLDLEELLQKIPELISRITKFTAFAVYLLDAKRNELTIAYSVGYPAETAKTLRVKVGEGLVGAAVADGQPLLVNDVHGDPRYVEAVPGSKAELVVPLRRKGRVIGALNLLSDQSGQFTLVDEAVLRQFGAGRRRDRNARLLEQGAMRQHARGACEVREFRSILNLDNCSRLLPMSRGV
jgi:sigma-B regulation protein RsbU (phosphoserine phosphatase)